MVEFCDSLSARLLRGVSKLGEFGLDVQDAINAEAERERLNKEMVRVKDEIDKVREKINSQDFVSRAPEEVVSENRTRHNELLEKLRKLESNLSHLPSN
jgi:valyl-tRNA synthetase